jgi:ligand-binding sensor domain-containing protein
MRGFSRLKWRYVVALALLLALCSIAYVHRQAERALRRATREVQTSAEMEVTVRKLLASTSAFEWISAPASFSGITVFQGDVWLCGASGLFRFDNHGTLVKHYRPGQELPAAALSRITSGVLRDAKMPELLLATFGEGILAFNGTDFRQILPSDPDARSVTALLPLSSGQLLVGTRKHGVLTYDGQTLRPFHPGLAALPVTELAGNESDLWVGTQDRGVMHWQSGRIETFSEGEGLPDPQVFSIALAGAKTFVGTAAGVAEFDRGRFVRVLAPGAFARTLYATDSMLLIGGGEGVSEISLQRTARLPARSRSAASAISDLRQIIAQGDTVYAVTPGSLFARDGNGSGWHRVISHETALLADGNISALAVDDSKRLWVGYFDRGLDIFGPDLRQASHIEDENVFCVNRILPDPASGAIAVATANGLVLFDRFGRKKQVLGRNDGLMADHITDAALYGNGMVLATPTGLTFMDSAGPRSLYAFHGLVNNHVYTVAAAGKQVLAGTLGGISILENENVAANYTVASRGLPHNWISAVVRVDNDWMVGTYGGGIVRLSSNGRFEAFDIATAKFEVYPNAMLATGQHVLAGTLGKGLYVYNRNSNRWTVITEGLPSLTVTALASGDGYIYVGTDNGLVRVLEQNLP